MASNLGRLIDFLWEKKEKLSLQYKVTVDLC